MSTLNQISDMDLPNFFVSLCSDDLISVCSSESKYCKVIAVGREAVAGELVLLTGAYEWITIKPKILPEGRVIPSNDGKFVIFLDAQRKIDSYSLITGAFNYY